MVGVNIRDLLDAGVHFGHQTRRWNPKMKPYIFTQRNGIYIVDLRQTAVAFRGALDFLSKLAAEGGTVMFVGTKRQAQEAVREAAERTGMYFVNQRWLGGLLTNFETIKKSVAKLKDLEAMEDDGRMDLLPKKEVIKLRRHKYKLFRNLEGIKDMNRIPDAMFVVDVRRERIAILEAANLGIPIVGVVDTNCDPDGIDFVVPGNDDALRSIRLFLGAAADAILAGKKARDDEVEEAALKAVAEAKAAEDAKVAEDGGEAAESEETIAEEVAEATPAAAADEAPAANSGETEETAGAEPEAEAAEPELEVTEPETEAAEPETEAAEVEPEAAEVDKTED